MPERIGLRDFYLTGYPKCANRYYNPIPRLSEIAQLIATIKRQLKAQGLTYREVARALKLSEASVKRVFATERFTVERLAKVSQLLGFSLRELLQLAAASTPALSVLTNAQESQLVADEKLLLVTVCALDHWSAQEIVEEYQITKQECLKRLILLDRMSLIELLPGDRIRRRVRRDFDWLPDGPIRHYFKSLGIADFLLGPFDQAEESMEFAHGLGFRRLRRASDADPVRYRRSCTTNRTAPT